MIAAQPEIGFGQFSFFTIIQIGQRIIPPPCTHPALATPAPTALRVLPIS